MKTRYFLYSSIIILSYTVILISYSQFRPIDGDEGYYATASRLVAEGNLPYRDFFYPQAPLLPYTYGLITFLFGHSLMALRTFSVICGVLTIILWALFLRIEYSQTPAVAYAALIVLVLNPYLISWNVTVKTYALSNLLSTGTLISLYLAIRSRKSIWYLCTGVSLGFCTSVRLLYGSIIGVVLIWMIIRSIKAKKGGSYYSRIIMMAIGVIISFLPMIVIYLVNPRAFLFNNIGYHYLRASYPPYLSRVTTAFEFLRITFRKHPYLLLQCSLALIGLYMVFKSNRDVFIMKQNITYVKLIMVITVVFILSSLVPFPLYEQYLTSPTASFFLPIIAVGLLTLSKISNRLMFEICFLALLLSVPEVYRETNRNSRDVVWYLSSYYEVSKYVEQNTVPNDVVLSFWPGYVYESGRKYFPGLENHFGLRVSDKISPLERELYHIASKNEIFAAISEKTPEIVIVGTWMKDFYHTLKDKEGEDFKEVLEANYNLAKKVGRVDIYRR